MENSVYTFSILKTTLDDLDSNSELLQTGIWARLKCMHGWDAFPFSAVHDNDSFKMLVLVRRIIPVFSLGYVPLGPSVPELEKGKEAYIESLGLAIRKVLPKHVLFLRFDLPWFVTGAGMIPDPLHERYRFRKSASDIQPPSTVTLNLRASEEKLFSLMKHKTRYNVRLAEKKGVKVTEGDANDLGSWYSLYKETANRDKIAIHSYGYYESFFILARENKNTVDVRLLLAHVEGLLVAGIIVAMKDKKCWYLYGASSNEMRNYMPNHALQWHAIRLAREYGCEEYDFFGIPVKENPADPMYGLYRFKTGFGGDITNRYGCYDVVYKPALYWMYSIAEKARMFYFKILKKKM